MQGGKDRTVVARRHALGILALLVCASLALAAEGRPAASQQSSASSGSEQAAPAGAPSIAPDQPAIQALATKMAESIEKSGKKTALVFDFAGPSETAKQWPEVTTFGQALASYFTAALATYASSTKIDSWSRLYRTLPPDNYFPDVIHDATTELWTAASLKSDLLVLGKLELQPDGTLKLHVVCYEVSSGRSVEGLSVPITFTPQMASMTKPAVEETSFANYPSATQKGYKRPTCMFCPHAQYPPEALSQKVQGTVEMEAVITPDGRAKGIKVLRALPFGLTDEAIIAVQKWRFAPARGPDGSPVAVRQIIEVSFYLG